MNESQKKHMEELAKKRMWDGSTRYFIDKYIKLSYDQYRVFEDDAFKAGYTKRDEEAQALQERLDECENFLTMAKVEILYHRREPDYKIDPDFLEEYFKKWNG